MTNKTKPELLAPAGNYNILEAAVKAGCDSVYFGGKQFNARYSAENFTLEEMEKAIDYCHARDVKAFLTVNTLYRSSELSNVLNFLKDAVNIGIDALIMQDLGAIKLVKDFFPDIPIHASTQMTAHSVSDVLFLESIGIKRVVLSRELSLEEIKNILAKTKIEVETFVHGALCVCYSGQCYMSYVSGGRSGNKGTCAQPCRMSYELLENSKSLSNKYLLSPKDIETVSILHKLVNSGIHSFKIEGRLKNISYVYGVVSIYRKYIDLIFEGIEHRVNDKDINELLQHFNRGGFSNGYYESFAGKNMMSLERPKHQGLYAGEVIKYDSKTNMAIFRSLLDFVPGDGIEFQGSDKSLGTYISKQIKKNEIVQIQIKGNVNKGNKIYRTFDKNLTDRINSDLKTRSKQVGISGKISILKDREMQLALIKNQTKVSVTGGYVSKAVSSPISKDRILEQLNKTGNTPFYFDEIETELDNDVFINISELNKLRREALELLEKRCCESFKRNYEETRIISPRINKNINHKLTVSVENKEQFDAAKSFNISRIYIEDSETTRKDLNYYISESKKHKFDLFIALRQIERTQEHGLCFYNDKEIQGFLVRTTGQVFKLKNLHKKVVSDFTIPITNLQGQMFLNEMNILATIGVEVNGNDLAGFDENSEVYAYGHLPIMVTHQCPLNDKDSGKFCNKKDNKKNYYLKSTNGLVYPIKRNCTDCYINILNHSPINLLNKGLNINSIFLRLSFTFEDKNKVKNILKDYSDYAKI